MYWLILLGGMGQIAVPPPRTIAEVRRSLNRFDELSQAALHAKAKSEIINLKGVANDVRRLRLRTRLLTFADLSLGISPPWQDAELSTVENITEEIAKPYDVAAKVVPPVPKKKFDPYTMKAWHESATGKKIWGWLDKNNPNVILSYPHEQPGYVPPQTYYVQPSPPPPMSISMPMPMGGAPACRT